jgi:hypothetical protein
MARKRVKPVAEAVAETTKEYLRLVEELEPFLDSVIRSVTLIKREIYGAK